MEKRKTIRIVITSFILLLCIALSIVGYRYNNANSINNGSGTYNSNIIDENNITNNDIINNSSTNSNSSSNDNEYNKELNSSTIQSSSNEDRTSFIISRYELYGIYDVNNLIDIYNIAIKELNKNNSNCDIKYQNNNYYVLSSILDLKMGDYKGDFKQCISFGYEGNSSLYILNSDGNLYYDHYRFDDEIVTMKLFENIKIKNIYHYYYGVFDAFVPIERILAKTYEDKIIILDDHNPLSYVKNVNTVFVIDEMDIYNDKTIENNSIISKYIFYADEAIFILGENDYLYEVNYTNFESKKISNKKVKEIKGFKFLNADEGKRKDYELEGKNIEFIFDE